MPELKNTGLLDVYVYKLIGPYFNRFLQLHSGKIVSIFIYGSCAGKEFKKGSSDINSAVIFSHISRVELKKSLGILNDGIRRGINAPLFLTPDYIMSSLDTFPIEFMEMKEHNILIYGEDIISGINIDPKNLRFICEEQIKGKLVRLRQGYLEIGQRRKGIEALIKDSFAGLLPVFKALLRVKGIPALQTKEGNIRAMGTAFDIDTDIFSDILADKRNDGKINGNNLEEALFCFIEQLEKLSIIADNVL
ncbi:MAG: hypothetical protein PHV77_02085 [Candidatus Omnitrophica bacterium]|jgi:predicted nucleotidyltransferase|nr:hypothetical protein [Candidatus Omnitrophota bacterium]